MLWGYRFESFVEYVCQFFKLKKESNKQVEKLIDKYALNSLYGKFGQKDITNKNKIMKRNEAVSLTKFYNYDLNDDYVIIKYSSRIN